MAKPWEEFGGTSTDSAPASGPWSDFKTPESPDSKPWEKFQPLETVVEPAAAEQGDTLRADNRNFLQRFADSRRAYYRNWWQGLKESTGTGVDYSRAEPFRKEVRQGTVTGSLEDHWKMGGWSAALNNRVSAAAMAGNMDELRAAIKEDRDVLSAVGDRMDLSRAGLLERGFKGAAESGVPMVESAGLGAFAGAVPFAGAVTGRAAVGAYWQQQGAGQFLRSFLRGKDVDAIDDGQLKEYNRIAQTLAVPYAAVEFAVSAVPGMKELGSSVDQQVANFLFRKAMQNPTVLKSIAKHGTSFGIRWVLESLFEEGTQGTIEEGAGEMLDSASQGDQKSIMQLVRSLDPRKLKKAFWKSGVESVPAVGVITLAGGGAAGVRNRLLRGNEAAGETAPGEEIPSGGGAPDDQQQQPAQDGTEEQNAAPDESQVVQPSETIIDPFAGQTDAGDEVVPDSPTLENQEENVPENGNEAVEGVPPVERSGEIVPDNPPPLNEMNRTELRREAVRLGVSQKGTDSQLRDRLARTQEGERIRARSFLKTVQNQAGITDGEMDRLAQVAPQTYQQERTSETFRKVREWLDSAPVNVTQAEQFVRSSESPSGAKGATFAALLDKYQHNQNYDAEVSLVEEYDRQLRESGRFIQASSLFASMSGKGFMKSVETFYHRHKIPVDDAFLDSIREQYMQAVHITDAAQKQAAVDAVVEQVAARAPTTWKDWAGSYRYTNMLSNPRSHERNVFGNLMQTLVSRPLSLIGQGRVRGSGTYMNQALRAIPNAFQAFADAWRSGDTSSRWFEATDTHSGKFESERLRQGADRSRLVRSQLLVGRFLEAQDKFFSAMIEAGETARLMKQGLPAEQAVAAARAMGDDLLYRAAIGKDMGNINKASFVRAIDSLGVLFEQGRRLPFLGKPWGWVLPFVRTPINIGKRMVEFSPLGFVRNPSGKMTREDFGRSAAGSVVTLAGALLAAAGQTTGSAPKDAEERRLWYDSGRRPWSVLIGRKWIPMWYFGSFAGALAVPAAVRDTWVDDSSSAGDPAYRKMLAFSGGLANFYASQTPVQSAGTFLDMMSGRTDFTTESSIAFMGGQFVPLSGFLRWANQLVLDPVYRRGGNFTEAVMKDYPFLSRKARPYIDSEGNPVLRSRLSTLLPFDVGTVDKEMDMSRAIRGETVKMRRVHDAELDKLSALYATGDIPLEWVSQWVGTVPIKEERSRLKQRFKSSLEQRGIKTPGQVVRKPESRMMNRYDDVHKMMGNPREGRAVNTLDSLMQNRRDQQVQKQRLIGR